MNWEKMEETRKKAYDDFFAGNIPLLPSAHDPLSAQAVEQKGFRIGFLSSEDVSKLYGYSSTHPISATEIITSTRNITQVSALALLVQMPLDARSSQLIIRQVFELRQLGIRAVQIDDDKVESTQELTQVIVQLHHYFPEMKIILGLRANVTMKGIEAAITKGNQLLHAGADFVLFQGLYTEGEYLYTAQYTNGPLLALLNEDNNDNLSHPALKDMGYHATILQKGCVHQMKKLYEESCIDM